MKVTHSDKTISLPRHQNTMRPHTKWNLKAQWLDPFTREFPKAFFIRKMLVLRVGALRNLPQRAKHAEQFYIFEIEDTNVIGGALPRLLQSRN